MAQVEERVTSLRWRSSRPERPSRRRACQVDGEVTASWWWIRPAPVDDYDLAVTPMLASRALVCRN
jgi:hypothetical protein